VKAIRVNQFGGPEVLSLEEEPTPVPVDDQVLVQVRAIGVNPVETYLRSGSNPNLELPYTPGTDAAGIVLGVGRGTQRIKVGDRVYTANTISGAYAEFAVCREGDVYALPASMRYEEGAAINIPYVTAYRALFQRGRVKEGEVVMVHGASGGVGIAATQLARQAGFAIIATAGTDRGCELALSQGAHHVFNHRSEGYMDEIFALTEGEGVDVILEMLSNVNLGNDLRILSMRGRVVVIGCRGKVEINPRDLMKREADIRGMLLFNIRPEGLPKIHAELRAAFEQGTFRPVIGQRFKLFEAARAHEAVMRPGATGKIVLTVES
jgi:NADPH2:quinone reductase